jgi:hypothetical protein
MIREMDILSGALKIEGSFYKSNFLSSLGNQLRGLLE